MNDYAFIQHPLLKGRRRELREAVSLHIRADNLRALASELDAKAVAINDVMTDEEIGIVSGVMLAYHARNVRHRT